MTIFNCYIFCFRFQLELALQQLLNKSEKTDFEELLFWGRISGAKADYYIALGIIYKDRYEFPQKRFYWCSQANGMVFEAFPALNDQHKDEYDALSGQLFKGEPMFVHKSVEVPIDQAEVDRKAAEKKAREEDELASTVEEEEEIVKINLKEIDRLHYHVLAIENDCHIIPQGSMKLTPAHEVERNEAFQGLTKETAFDLNNYSHFRNVQDKVKKDNLEADDAIF